MSKPETPSENTPEKTPDTNPDTNPDTGNAALLMADTTVASVATGDALAGADAAVTSAKNDVATTADSKQKQPSPLLTSTPSIKPHGRWTRPRVIVVVIIAIILFVLGGMYVRSLILGSADDQDKLLTALVQKADIEDAITATGSLQPKDFVDVGTQVSGQLKQLHVEVGAIVKAKDLLAEIDPHRVFVQG